MSPSVFVLDAYALVAFIEDEPGAEAVLELLSALGDGTVSLLITSVNLGEVWYALARAYGTPAADEKVAALLDLGISLEVVDWSLARAAAAFKRRGGISFADCFAAALAQLHEAPVVTGDPEFRRLEGEVRVRWMPVER
jgi:ribonuclease VapC